MGTWTPGVPYTDSSQDNETAAVIARDAAATAFPLLANNGSDYTAATFRTNLGHLAREGHGTGLLTSHLFDNVYRDNAGHMANVPGTTISAVTKIYTVPTGYTAWIQMGVANLTASPVNLSVFAMTDGSTPTATDRMWFLATSANNTSTIGTEIALGAGGTLWAFASAGSSLTVTPYVLLIPTPIAGGTWTPRLDKQLTANTDNAIYTAGSGNWAQNSIVGTLHNTTGGAITVLTKIHRAATNDTVTVSTVSSAANGNNGLVGGQAALTALDPGDTLYVNPNGSGINLGTFWCERPLAGMG